MGLFPTFLIALFALAASPLWFPFVVDKLRRDPMQQAVDMVMLSLQTIPEEWSQDDYRITHKPSGIAIWTANEAYGLKINNVAPNATNRKRLHKAISQRHAVTIAAAVRDGKRP